ncbi:hypothetical protein LRS06_16780 [Hymenobacter sp. J193]|uniref:hypothetical protein n=1 Tax=Hymenobacter sp. J193 TaxID=2898429 RepID=UPI0021517F6F|nr:hypothetical protein [Hymenobacter sp. J193]MCR5889393.1 hypothetical protein [Hymenobacter sp. J193]
MKQPSRKWELKLIKSRYEYLQLTTQQAEQLDQYEQENLNNLTVWEELDYQYTVFQEILSENQFLLYKENREEEIQQHKHDLTIADERESKHILFHEEINTFYEKDFLPFFHNNTYTKFVLRTEEHSKVAYLKAEYGRHLLAERSEIITEHFRYYRTFKPLALKASLLQHKRAYIWPEYDRFLIQADEPTKQVAAYLQKQPRYIISEYEKIVEDKFNELRIFFATTVGKYFKPTTGWHADFSQLSEEELIQRRNMCLLLLDIDKYGYQDFLA